MKKGPRAGLPTSSAYLLDRFSAEDVRQAREFADKLLAFHWKYYTELAFQRYQARDAIRTALLEADAGRYEFSGWQRLIRYQWSLVPLSSAGSLQDPGGRFNFGAIDRPRFPVFPALYIAQDKETALQEVLGQPLSHTVKHGEAEVTALDLALAKPDSITCVAVSGALESCVDLTQPRRLSPLVDVIKEFTLSSDVARMARSLKIPPPRVITRLDQLMGELLRVDWRDYPAQVDVPSNSQIFGQIVMGAGIDGIVFPSKFSGKNCVALFPERLADSESCVDIVDPTPDPRVIRRLDRDTWRQLAQE